ncbi:MAG: methyltransferase domain-containing protein [Caldilinea sp. CFX5]|nr:methyltransferase domain-containing protein [Caldilinea sp. CFX5]
MNRVYPFGAGWLAALPDLHHRLQREPPMRIADMGCADGWFSIALARRYPTVRVDGFDLDEAIIDLAWCNAHNCGLTDRLTFHVRDVSEATLNGRYDLCIAHQGLAGMYNPVGVLATMRRLAGEKGSVLVTAVNLNGNAGFKSGSDDDQLRRYAFTVGFRTADLLSVSDYSLYCYRFYQ